MVLLIKNGITDNFRYNLASRLGVVNINGDRNNYREMYLKILSINRLLNVEIFKHRLMVFKCGNKGISYNQSIKEYNIKDLIYKGSFGEAYNEILDMVIDNDVNKKTSIIEMVFIKRVINFYKSEYEKVYGC